jgi:Mrp family chromosome partitioning ATPase
MSIIERALNKQRAEDFSGNETSRTGGRARRSREFVVSAADPARPRREPAASISLDLDALRAGGILPPLEATDRIQEQIRRIKWPLLETAMVGRAAASEATPPTNLVMITSSVPAEGKTYVSFNIALGIAREKDFSVLLVDGDVAKRHLSTALNVADRPGLTDALADESLDPESLVLGTGVPGLVFLPAGKRTSVAPEFFGSQRMIRILSVLGHSDRQRIVLFDSAPLLTTNESPVLSHLVDQIIMVVRAEETPQPVVLEAIALLDKSKTIRCLLNQTRLNSVSEHYYGYGYYPHEPPKKP